jgi:hypothetical protein
MRIALALLCVSATAVAQPVAAEGPQIAGEDLFRPPIEWSTWIRIAAGLEQRTAFDPAARTTGGPRPPQLDHRWETGVGVEGSLALSMHGTVRLGAWAELRGLEPSRDGFAGAELVLTAVPKRLDLFLYEGHGILAIRAGRSASDVTGALAYGYLAPWKLEGPCRIRFFDIYTGVCAPRPPRTTRYMVGVRLVATMTRAIDDPRTWSATLGVETELLGSLRAMLGIRSWY